MQTTYGTYYDTLPDGRVLVATPMPEGADDSEVRLLWPDKETITREQQKKIFAIIEDMATDTGNEKEYLRKSLLGDFLRENFRKLQMTAISMAIGADCDKSTASMIIDFLIERCLDFNIHTRQPLREYADDLGRYTYSALMHKSCLICGRKADLHHVDQIGMGYNRETKPQLGDLVISLCREHHSEYHSIGKARFEEKYHARAIPMDKKIALKYGITGRAAT